MTEPIRAEFTARQAKGINDTFRIESSAYNEQEGGALVSVTHSDGTTEQRQFMLVKTDGSWKISTDSPYVPPTNPMPAPAQKTELPRITSIHFSNESNTPIRTDKDGLPQFSRGFRYMVNITLDRPVTEPFELIMRNESTNHFHELYKVDLTNTKKITVENFPSNIITLHRQPNSDARINKFKDTFTIGDSSMSIEYEIR